MLETIRKSMRAAGWPNDDINYLLRIVKANDGAAFVDLDPQEVNIKCKNGRYANIKKG